MREAKISENVIGRMPLYLRKLDILSSDGIDHISSSELGRLMGFTASQVRHDFFCFGEFGQQGYGYNIENLRRQIAAILGISMKRTAVLIGAGRLGSTLVTNYCFPRFNVEILACFDIRAEVIGQKLNGVRIYDAKELPAFLNGHGVDICILTVPRSVVAAVAEEVCHYNIRAIWNISDIDLHLSNKSVVVESLRFSDSLLKLCYRLEVQSGRQ